MRYQMKERMWTLRDTFDIKDESGHKVYKVKGKLLAWGDKLSMSDRDGNEVAHISERKLSLRPRYKIYCDGKKHAEVKKNFISFFRDKFTVNVSGDHNYRITGSILDYDYKFERQGRLVAQVSKKFFSIRDSYGIDIVDGEDDVAILAACVVIDKIAHDGDDDD